MFLVMFSKGTVLRSPRCSCNQTKLTGNTNRALPECHCHKLWQQENIIQRVTYHFFYPFFYNFSPNILLRKHEVGNLTSASLSAPLIIHPSSKSVLNVSRVMLLYDKEAKRFLSFSFSSQECFCSVCRVVRPIRFGLNQASLHRSHQSLKNGSLCLADQVLSYFVKLKHTPSHNRSLSKRGSMEASPG